MYRTVCGSAAALAEIPPQRSWEPVEIDTVQFVILHNLGTEDLQIDDPAFIAFVESKGRSPSEVISSIISTGLAALDGKLLKLITANLKCVFLPDGRRVAADDNTGRLSRWVDNFMREWEARTATDGEQLKSPRLFLERVQRPLTSRSRTSGKD
jgi:hypothetical protein